MKSFVPLVFSCLAGLSLASPITDMVKEVRDAPVDLPRLVVYFQTTHDQRGLPISMLPLINEKGIALTHIIVCSLHVNRDSEIHLNDFPPSDPHFYTLWNETQYMKNAGVKVMGMVGGAAAGSFDSYTLDGDEATFEHYYGQLSDVIREFGLEGMDLDVEQRMSQAGITRLVNRLYADFGSSFIVTLAPVASALQSGGNLSGFDYKTLEATDGPRISFYNAQFYSGFGSMRTPRDYKNVINAGWKPADILAGQLTSPNNGYGYTPESQLNATVINLRETYGQIGGIMGFEYFNSQPGGEEEPWRWAQVMTDILRPNQVPDMRISPSDAQALSDAWWASASASASAGNRLSPTVDYFAMVNA